jgi:hypothetical protein
MGRFLGLADFGSRDTAAKGGFVALRPRLFRANAGETARIFASAGSNAKNLGQKQDQCGIKSKADNGNL